MKYAKYVQHAKYIAASDSGSIRERWRLGRSLLTDPEATTPAGHLKHGVLGKLIAKAAAAGAKLTQTEISRSLRCGKAYPSEAEISRAATAFGNWWALVEKGFPPIEVTLDADTDSFDPRTDGERQRDAVAELARLGDEAASKQLTLFELFPADRFGKLATLTELDKYAVECDERTERHLEADRRRRAYLNQLFAAVGGNENATWEEAQAALDAAQQAP
jgi:hypothetical protein